MSTAEVFKQALEMEEEDRAALAGLLITSLDGESDPGVAEAWDREIARRVAELDAGTAETVPWEEVRQSLLRRINGR